MYSQFMKEALKEARKAFDEDEIPVGAVVIKDKEIISRAHNRVEALKDPSAHAEILALKNAAEILNTPNLSGTELIVTLEPCVMCCGAMINAKIKTLIYGAENIKYGAVKTHTKLLDIQTFNHNVSVIHSVLKDECAALLTEFFRKKRIQQ